MEQLVNDYLKNLTKEKISEEQLLLVFLGNKNIPFTHMVNWSKETEQHFGSLQGRMFEVVYSSEQLCPGGAHIA
jgi:hypothetical protein